MKVLSSITLWPAQQENPCMLECSSTPCGSAGMPPHRSSSRQLLAAQPSCTAPYLNFGRPFKARFIFRLVPSLSMLSTCLLNAALKLCFPASHRSQGVPCTYYAKPPVTTQVKAKPWQGCTSQHCATSPCSTLPASSLSLKGSAFTTTACAATSRPSASCRTPQPCVGAPTDVWPPCTCLLSQSKAITQCYNSPGRCSLAAHSMVRPDCEQ